QISMQRAALKQGFEIVADPARKGRVGKDKSSLLVDREESDRRIVGKVYKLFTFFSYRAVDRMFFRHIVDAPVNKSGAAGDGLGGDHVPALVPVLVGKKFNGVGQPPVRLVGQQAEMRHGLVVVLKQLHKAFIAGLADAAAKIVELAVGVDHV